METTGGKTFVFKQISGLQMEWELRNQAQIFPVLPAPKPLWASVVRSLEGANSNCREFKLHRSTFFFFAFCLHILSACPDPAVPLCCCLSATLRSPVHPAPALLADDSCLTLMPVFNLVFAWRAQSKTPLGLVQLQSWCSGMVPPVIPSQERQGWLGVL